MKPGIFLFGIYLVVIAGCQAQGSKQTKPSELTTPDLPPSQYVIHKGETRGETKEDWLHSRHTFSFNHYYDRDRVGFGALLVLNDDWVKAGAGFDTHHHQDMEIVSIPLYGGIIHQDSRGSSGLTAVDRQDGFFSVQQMTAGSGIAHSEYNASKTDSVRFLQIWIMPDKQGRTPGYRQKRFSFNDQKNRWQTLVSPHDPQALFIHQKTILSMADLEARKMLKYSQKYEGGIYAFVLEGKVSINGVTLARRDGIGIVGVHELTVSAKETAKILLIEVPVDKAGWVFKH